MSSSDSAYPWVFRRDEVDLLEDQIEDLYERYESPEDKRTIEQEVFDEQLETEELFEENLKSKLAHDFLVFGSSIMNSQEHHDAPVDDELSSRYRQEAFRQPLYVHARKWALQVFTHAQKRYETQEYRTKDVFRVCANANFVPIKIALGLSEEFRDDAVGIEMALQEYQLVHIYIDRIIQSLERILPEEPELQKILEMIGVAHHISESLSLRERELRRRQQGTPPSYG